MELAQDGAEDGEAAEEGLRDKRVASYSDVEGTFCRGGALEELIVNSFMRENGKPNHL